MEAFSLLKYWRSTSGGGGDDGGKLKKIGSRGDANKAAEAAETQVVTAVDDENGNDDDGPFFDLEFTTVPEEEGEDDEPQRQHGQEEEDEEHNVVSCCHDDEVENERKFTLSSSSSASSSPNNNDHSTTTIVQNLTSSLSPSDDLFFKGKLLPIEPSSDTEHNPTATTKPPNFPVSFMKSATKLRVFMLGLKKSKPNSDKSTSEPTTSPNKNQNGAKKTTCTSNNNNKSFTVKFKVEQVPIVSLFTRDNSGKNGLKSSSSSQQSHKKQHNNNSHRESCPDDKKFTKVEAMHNKYLNKVKPLYVNVSKLRFSGQQLKVSPKGIAEKGQQHGGGDTAAATATTTKVGFQLKHQGSGTLLPSARRLRVVCKHLGKSRSASSAVVAAQPTPNSGAVSLSSQRRDDSLLQQQDGIQSAILHCKRSFNASSSTTESESGMLARSASDPSVEMSKKSCSEHGGVIVVKA